MTSPRVFHPLKICKVVALLGRNSMKIVAKKDVYKKPRPERRWSRDRANSLAVLRRNDARGEIRRQTLKIARVERVDPVLT